MMQLLLLLLLLSLLLTMMMMIILRTRPSLPKSCDVNVSRVTCIHWCMKLCTCFSYFYDYSIILSSSEQKSTCGAVRIVFVCCLSVVNK
jgi:hypothetical protein